MTELTKQYLLEIQFAMDEENGVWKYGAAYDKGIGSKFYTSKEAAEAGLARLLRKFNLDYTYGDDGKRRETHEIGGGLGADMVITKEIDDMNRIVHWKIKVREVTPWEEVESK